MTQNDKPQSFVFLVKYRFLKVKIYHFFLLVYFISFVCNAQTEEYYITPSKRTHKNADITSTAYPNLETQKNYFYIDGKGITYKNYALFETSDERFLFQENLRHIIPEFTAGVNFNDKFQVDVFYQKWVIAPNFTATYDNRNILRFTNAQDQNNLGIRYKKKLFLLDKITKSTYIFGALGIRYNLNHQGGILGDEALVINLGSRNMPNLINLDYTLQSNNKPFSGEIGIELRNRIAPPVEVALHSYLILTPKGIQETSVDIYNGPASTPVKSFIQTGILNPSFAVSLRYNFLISKTYVSKL